MGRCPRVSPRLDRGYFRFLALGGLPFGEEVSPPKIRNFCSLFSASCSLLFAPGLLRGRLYANLSFCAVERAEWQCVRAVFKGSGAVSGWIGLA